MQSTPSSLGPYADIGQGRAAVRTALGRAPMLGLTTSAIDAMAAQARVTSWDVGDTIATEGDGNDLVSVLLSGVVKVVCRGQRGAPVIMQFVRPGQFFRLSTPASAPRRGGFSAIAHQPAVVASVTTQVMTAIVGGLPPGRALQMMAYSWRGLSRQLYDKCLLLTMPLADRLLHELAALARDFGHAHERGVLVDLPLTHADLA